MSHRGKITALPCDYYHDKEVIKAWTIILRKMSGNARTTAADGLVFTEPISLHRMRLWSGKNKLLDFIMQDITLRPLSEIYHLVACPTPHSSDHREGVVLIMASDTLPHYREQWRAVMTMAVATGWVTALDIINPIFPDLGTTWEEMMKIIPEEAEDPPEPEHPKPKTVTTNAYKRSRAIATEAKQLAKGICQLCGRPAPFDTKKGEPYLETHHIVWLSEGGEDTVKNTAALCPNCHRRVHILKDPEDQNDLL